jgi:hypothetical protein
MRYGPYSVPGMMEKSIMGESGSLWNCADDKIPKPCEECVLFRLQAGLEYPNGTSANIDSGMWLHHVCCKHASNMAREVARTNREFRWFLSVLAPGDGIQHATKTINLSHILQ